MAWSIGHSLIVVLALLLGLAAGWLLRGRRGVQGNSIVEGDPVAGLAVISTPTTAATTDEVQPAAAVDPAPTAVADEPVPVDTVSAPAAVTAPDGPTPVPVPTEAPSTIDPADMALTEPPPPVPAAEQSEPAELRSEPVVDSTPEPVAVEEQPAPAAVVAPRKPADDLPPVDSTPLDSTPADEPIAATPADEALPATPADEPVAATPADDAETSAKVADPAPVEAPVTTDAVDVDPVDAHRVDAESVDADAVHTNAVSTDADAESVDAESVRAAVATPPGRPTVSATPPVRSTADTAISTYEGDPTGPADDFRRIQGIGPKMAAALQDAGVRTYGQLGELDEPALRDLIRAAGLRAAPGLASWPQQARVLAGAGEEMAAVLPNSNQA
ncbi:helix-hairpin-helix domain-containing protein [Micromonospora zamorensis]|uniref:helix-hairpin-helix domain-containing protein n=1 Tax=Micromonospora zamorensis TaxID=709883 RepID=UPI003D89DD97